jgi:hypothetical protein
VTGFGRFGLTWLSAHLCATVYWVDNDPLFVNLSPPSPAQELELMCKMKVKAEIQALSSFDFQYLTHVYLPEKLKEGDWI